MHTEEQIVDIWAENLDDEMDRIRDVIQKYNYVAMDTEFPGVVARPIGEFRTNADYHYQLLKCNVDMLKCIQLGLTFMDENGETPPGTSTWQFNFKFNLQEDMYSQDSIDLLVSCGIQFKRHEQSGVCPMRFAELLITSGVVLIDGVNWISFHSGYDFGYLLKILSGKGLPTTEDEFFRDMKDYFKTVYDVKYMAKNLNGKLKGGLKELSEQLEITRVGQQHQAGSDSLLTGKSFFKIQQDYFAKNAADLDKCAGHLYGFGLGGGAMRTTNNNSSTNGSPYGDEQYNSS